MACEKIVNLSLIANQLGELKSFMFHNVDEQYPLVGAYAQKPYANRIFNVQLLIEHGIKIRCKDESIRAG